MNINSRLILIAFTCMILIGIVIVQVKTGEMEKECADKGGVVARVPGEGVKCVRVLK